MPTTPANNKISDTIIHGSFIGTAFAAIAAAAAAAAIAAGVLPTIAAALLFLRSGSGVALPPVAVAVTVVGMMKLALQTTEPPATREVAVGTDGVQLMVAAAGKPVMLQVAAEALLGPRLLQVKLPFTVLPTAAPRGRLSVVLMSALGFPNVTDALPGGLRPTDDVIFDALLV